METVDQRWQTRLIREGAPSQMPWTTLMFGGVSILLFWAKLPRSSDNMQQQSEPMEWWFHLKYQNYHFLFTKLIYDSQFLIHHFLFIRRIHSRIWWVNRHIGGRGSRSQRRWPLKECPKWSRRYRRVHCRWRRWRCWSKLIVCAGGTPCCTRRSSLSVSDNLSFTQCSTVLSAFEIAVIRYNLS